MADVKPFCVRQANRVRDAWYKPAKAGNVFLAYAGIIAAVAVSGVAFTHEADRRTTDFCSVVVHIHDNAVFRQTTAQRALDTTIDYLNDSRSKEESPALFKRIMDNFPQTQANLTAANREVEATAIPSSCERLDIKPKRR